ncbi:FMN-binding negative transcriptional regulator [Pokkaliibacter sp. CJK22405]|uniref:FMN-binding negative transcriptional regulator n=1 Tax=Pokkaliibacter sp. CJK22405 TaxID=3384615 RepID=UPI0039851F30
MYLPTPFKQDDEDELLRLMQAYPFATLVTHTQGAGEQGAASLALEANHLPLQVKNVDGALVLQGHIAKANPLWKHLQEGSPTLVIFHGPDCYISPNYYPSKKDTGKEVPTWNYAVVHVHGTLHFRQEPEWLLALLDQLSTTHEASQPEPWSIHDAPEEYIQAMLKAIVGIEIKVTSLTGKWKLGQNKTEQNRRGMAEHLAQSDDAKEREIAAIVNYQLNIRNTENG